MSYRPPRDLRLHPEAGLVPRMQASEYEELLADTREHGIKVPLDIDGDVILDGAHRFRAAMELKLVEVPVRAVKLNGETQLAWMVKAAVLRRHLTDDQRAMMAAIYAKRHPKPKGPVPGATKKGTPRGSPSNDKPKRRTKTEHKPALAEAAKAMSVSVSGAVKAAALLPARPGLAERVAPAEAVHRAQKNSDRSSDFVAYDVRSFVYEPPLLVASSHTEDEAPNQGLFRSSADGRVERVERP